MCPNTKAEMKIRNQQAIIVPSISEKMKIERRVRRKREMGYNKNKKQTIAAILNKKQSDYRWIGRIIGLELAEIVRVARRPPPKH